MFLRLRLRILAWRWCRYSKVWSGRATIYSQAGNELRKVLRKPAYRTHMQHELRELVKVFKGVGYNLAESERTSESMDMYTRIRYVTGVNACYEVAEKLKGYVK